MKYLTIFVMSMTVLLFVACSSGGGEPTAVPEATEIPPALATAVSTEAPAATEESYPANEPTLTPAPVDSYPAAAPTAAPYDPYPDQDDETTSETGAGSADPAEVNLDEAAATIQLVSEDLATRLASDVSEITVVSAETREWADSSFGCPAPGYAYAQVITSGYQITLEASSEQYTYHTDLNGNFVLCGEDGQPVE